MKKKFLAVVLCVTMVLSMVAGCGGSDKKNSDEKSYGTSKRDYKKDMTAILEINELDKELKEMLGFLIDDLRDFAEDDLLSDIKDVDMSTRKGAKIKDIYLEIIDIRFNLWDLFVDVHGDISDAKREKLTDKAEEYLEQIEDLTDDMNDALEDFLDAAEDAGVDDDDLEDFEDKLS